MSHAAAVVERRLLAGVPLLIVHPAGRVTPLPTVLWFHGFGADKELHLPELQRFAGAGLLAIGIDAVGHGQRRLADFEQRFAQPPEHASRLFDSLVAQTAAELPQLIDALVDCGLVDCGRIAVAGVSMGGCIVYGASSSDCPLRAAVALMGSPAWLHPDGADFPVDRFFPTALLSITAENDEVVPPMAARALHGQLEARYRQDPERLDYRTIAGASHFMSPEDWSHVLDQTGAWLVRFAADGDPGVPGE
ncbi:MAG: hypothetical protein KDI64_11100 [Candidatus Accumulibacter sp.]|nr:hypothetical protein [Accumulibacter sp.]